MLKVLKEHYPSKTNFFSISYHTITNGILMFYVNTLFYFCQIRTEVTHAMLIFEASIKMRKFAFFIYYVNTIDFVFKRTPEVKA